MAVTLQRDALLRQLSHQRNRTFPLGVGDWYFHRDMLSPSCDTTRLPFHFGEIVGENLERDRPIRDRDDHLACKCFVSGNARLAHQGRVGRKSLDERVGIHFKHAGLVSAVGKNLHVELVDALHPFNRG